MIGSGPENLKPSVGKRIENLNTQIGIIRRSNRRPPFELSGLEGEVENLGEENPWKQEQKEFEEELVRLEKEIEKIEFPESEDE
jgi:hypothetical protein